MKLIGFRNADFVSKDGRTVCGVSLFVSSPIAANGSGEAAMKVFVTQRLMDSVGYQPCVGDDVEFLYNRFGKVIELRFAHLV